MGQCSAAFHYACKYGFLKVVEMLIKKSAELKIKLDIKKTIQQFFKVLAKMAIQKWQNYLFRNIMCLKLILMPQMFLGKQSFNWPCKKVIEKLSRSYRCMQFYHLVDAFFAK